MSSSVERLLVDVEVKSSPDKFWKNIRESDKLYPKVFPELYKSINIIEGDGKTVGSVRHIIFADQEVQVIKESKEKLEALDEEKRSVTYSVIEGEVLQFYKTFKAKLEVEAKGEGSLVKWSCEFEKLKEDAPNPQLMFKDFVVKTFQDVDAYLLQAN